MLFNPDLTFFTWVTFGILFFLLARYGWDPILSALHNREEKIQTDLSEAEEQREKAEHLLQERKEALNEARDEARDIIEDARQKGKQTRESIVQEAEDQAESMIESAQQEIESQRKRAMQSVEGQIGELSVQLAERILREEIDDDVHRNLVDRFLDEVETESETEEVTVG